MCWRRLTLVAAITLFAGCSPTVTPTRAPSESPRVVLQPTAVVSGTLYAPAALTSGVLQTWLARMERTVALVADTDLGPLDDQWDGRIAIELPATASDYLALAGSDSGEAAAVTRCDVGGSRITINPRIQGEDPGYLDSLLLHEAVHGATGSACTEAPLWIEEGLAEWLTARHDLATRQANQQWLKHELATGGFPSGLPADDAFAGTAAQVSGAYALADFAVATALERLGHDQAMAYFANPDEPTTRVLTDWYLTGLRAGPVPSDPREPRINE